MGVLNNDWHDNVKWSGRDLHDQFMQMLQKNINNKNDMDFNSVVNCGHKPVKIRKTENKMPFIKITKICGCGCSVH